MSSLHRFLENGKKNGKLLLNETVFGKKITLTSKMEKYRQFSYTKMEFHLSGMDCTSFIHPSDESNLIQQIDEPHRNKRYQHA